MGGRLRRSSSRRPRRPFQLCPRHDSCSGSLNGLSQELQSERGGECRRLSGDLCPTLGASNLANS